MLHIDRQEIKDQRDIIQFMLKLRFKKITPSFYNRSILDSVSQSSEVRGTGWRKKRNLIFFSFILAFVFMLLSEYFSFCCVQLLFIIHIRLTHHNLC